MPLGLPEPSVRETSGRWRSLAWFSGPVTRVGVGLPSRSTARLGGPMATSTERDKKLVQYLNEAYGKEKELETALAAHIGMTERAAYKKRLRKHLTETKAHARALERRIKALGGSPATLQRLAGQATAALKGPVHVFRAADLEEKLLKNAKTEHSEEAEEKATYTAIEAFAAHVGDRDTVKLARGRR